VEKGIIRVIHVHKHRWLTDIFTKTLARSSFFSILFYMSIENIFIPFYARFIRVLRVVDQVHVLVLLYLFFCNLVDNNYGRERCMI